MATAAAKKTDTTKAEEVPDAKAIAKLDESQLQYASRENRIQDSTLREITTWDQAIQLGMETYGEIDKISEHLGSGFSVIPDKSLLEGRPFYILSFAFTEGDYGNFSSMSVITPNNEKWIVNDGSTGICRQLIDYAAERGRFGAVMVEAGLRASEYDTCTGPDGKSCGKVRNASVEQCPNCGDTSTKRRPATTYYLDLSTPQ